MAIGFGTQATLAKSTADSSAAVSGSVDLAGANGMAIIVTYEDGGDVVVGNRKRISSITYNGVGLTALAQQFHPANNATANNIEIWGLVSPASGSNTWQVNFSNASEDSSYIIGLVPITGLASFGATNTSEGLSAASDTINDSLTFTDATATALIGICGQMAGMGPIDSVSGWTVDHEDEQGAVDSGDMLAVGHYDTDAASSKTFSWSPNAATVASRRRAFAAVELIPSAASKSVSIPAANQAVGATVEVTSTVAYNGAVTAQIVGGGALTVSNVSGTTCDVTLPATSVFDDSDATWEGIRWGVNQTLRITDTDGDFDATINLQPPVDDHFDARGASVDFEVVGSADGDEYYVDIISGDGEGLPSVGGFQGNTVPTVVRFRCFDVSAAKWLSYLEHTFDLSSSSLDGTYADSFTDSDSTVITAHAPDTDPTGGGYTIEKDVSTAPAPANAVTIDGNRLKIDNANEGAVIDVCSNQPDLTVDWQLQPGDSGMDMVVQVCRVNDTEHVHMYVTQAGLVRVNQRVASSNIAIDGVNEANLAAFAADTTHSFRIKVVGQAVTVYVDDVQVISCSLSVAPSTLATNIGLFSAGTSPVFFDNANAYCTVTAEEAGAVIREVTRLTVRSVIRVTVE